LPEIASNRAITTTQDAPSECTVTGGMYRLKPEECERGSAGEAKEFHDSEHLGTQKEPMYFTWSAEQDGGKAFACLNSGGDAARPLFLVRIGIGTTTENN
jgi:hypothetical protein